MAWWRSRRRGGAGLALLALAIQIVASFGHLHLQDLRPASAAVAAQAAPAGPAHPPLPPGAPDDDCPICVAMHLTASGVAPAPPSVAVPSDVSRISHSIDTTRDLSPARYVLFRTRAPPAA